MSESLFVADVHLSAQRPETLALFLRFLQDRASRADALYILGDLFDAWIGDDDDSDLARQVRAAFKTLTEGGTTLYIQHGNRDFLIGEEFCRATGAQLLDETTVVDLDGKPTLLMHGDLLCSDDTDYQQARLTLRSPAFAHDFLSRPLDERAALAAAYRQKSGESTSLKAADIMDVNDGTVVDYLHQHGVDRLIHGHTHRPGEHTHQIGSAAATRWVLAEWHSHRGEYLRSTDATLSREAFA